MLQPFHCYVSVVKPCGKLASQHCNFQPQLLHLYGCSRWIEQPQLLAGLVKGLAAVLHGLEEGVVGVCCLP